MAYKSFLIQQYQYTHENVFFRTISNALKKGFENERGLHILIGSLSCNGHQIDALFISNGKIIVIDFKNYGGKLTFSENNPWQMLTKEGKLVFVSGGNSVRNPYQQVLAYRNSLSQFLEAKTKEFLEPNRTNINLRHISGNVIFHQPIEIQQEIDTRIQCYFDVTDNDNCINRIKDRFSNELILSDIEIERILKILDVSEENLYDESVSINEDEQKNTPSKATERMQMVKKTLENVGKPENSVEKILTCYEVLLNLERQKEPAVKEEYPYLIKWDETDDIIKINLKDNENFEPEFLKNKSERFPKNVFVGIKFSINEEIFPLLYTIVQSRDILSFQEIEVPVKDFNLYSKPLEDRQYPDNNVEEIANEISVKSSLYEKIEVLQKHFENAKLQDSISLALSEESPFTAQLLSELKKIKKENLIQENSLLERFLLKKDIPNNISGTTDNFIQITSLTQSQKEAVRHSFSQPLSVITGPPGTGKTQVILNILANAVLHNKKVLVASKNNQAVDNVKEKLSLLLEEPDFFLRFGSRNEMKENIKPAVRSFISKIHHKNYTKNTDEVTRKLENKYKEFAKYQQETRQKENLLKNIQLQKQQVTAQEQKIELHKQNYNDFLEQNKEIIQVFQNLSAHELQELKSEYIKIKNEVLSKYSGINKVLFNWFSKGKYALSLTNSFDLWNTDLKELAKKKNINISLEKLSNGGAIITSCITLIDFLSEGEKICIEKDNFEQKTDKLESELVQIQSYLEQSITKLEEWKSKGKELYQKIECVQEEINELAIPLLNEKIQNKLADGDASVISNYIEYIPENVPWKNDEIPRFVNITRDFLDTFNIISVTSLSIKTSIPLAEELFDMVIIDEASQCDIISAIPLILRAKQLVVIGDPMQLKHISKVQKYEQDYIKEQLEISSELSLDYINNSLYDYCYDLSIHCKIDSVFLKDHFRCHPDIVGYSNKFIYNPLMGQEMNIRTKDEDFTITPKGLLWKNVKGKWLERKKQNNEEVDAVINLAIELLEKNPTATIGITTPFRDQVNAIKEKMPIKLRDNIKVDSIHSFQGQERDIIIFSLVVTTNAPERSTKWINKDVPYLINVAVTRAKNTLYVVGNLEYTKKLGSGKLYELANYVREESVL